MIRHPAPIYDEWWARCVALAAELGLNLEQCCRYYTTPRQYEVLRDRRMSRGYPTLQALATARGISWQAVAQLEREGMRRLLAGLGRYRRRVGPTEEMDHAP